MSFIINPVNVNSPYSVIDVFSNYSVAVADLNAIINCYSGTFTVDLPSITTVDEGFAVTIWNTGSGVITVDAFGSETIDNKPTLTLQRQEGSQLVMSASGGLLGWSTGNKKTMWGFAENPFSTTLGKPVASGNTSMAIGAQSVASGASSMALGYLVEAAANNSLSAGKNNAGNGSVTTSGGGSTAIGGSYASGIDSFAAAIANNTSAYGALSANSIALGDRNKANSTGAAVIGGSLSSAGGNSSFVSGSGCSTGFTSFGSVALGNGATNTVAGKFSFSGTYYSAFGTTQLGMMCLSKTTPDAVATVLTSTGGTASTSNQLILPDATAIAFSGIIVARQKNTGGTASAAWNVSGLIRRDTGVGTTTLITSTVTVISNVPGWTLALSADTVNGGLAVTATGAAATDIRWHARIDSSEVTYA